MGGLQSWLRCKNREVEGGKDWGLTVGRGTMAEKEAQLKKQTSTCDTYKLHLSLASFWAINSFCLTHLSLEL
jgi:hypothetical protein